MNFDARLPCPIATAARDGQDFGVLGYVRQGDGSGWWNVSATAHYHGLSAPPSSRR